MYNVSFYFNFIGANFHTSLCLTWFHMRSAGVNVIHWGSCDCAVIVANFKVLGRLRRQLFGGHNY